MSAHGAPVGAIIVPDAQLLFNGDFKRSGVDLILSRDDRELVLQDYFKGEKRAALSSPDGAHLTGDIIDALTGYQQFAQAGGGASAGKVIGHLTKLIGSASAIRNGVSIILNNGDNVEKGDVVQSGSSSTVGITFIDGTVFGLSSNARMVLNEMVYDPNGSNNSSLLSLVAGTISFVAGETAKHGDMKVDTPVATMGIRGTAVLVEIDFDVPGQGAAPAAKFQVLVEPDGTTGRYVLFDKLTLAPIATVDQAGVVKSLSQGILTSYSAPLSPDVQKLITDVFALKFTDNTNTKTQNHQFTDSVVPQTFEQFKLADGATAIPVFVNVPTPDITATSGPTGPADANPHIPGAPFVVAVDGALIEAIGVTHSSAIDTVSNVIRFADLNAGDTPTLQTKFDSFTYQDAQHNDVTKTLNAQQLADIAAVEANLALVPDPGNKNTGSVTWTYSMVDSAFDFIAAGETLTLTYIAQVDNNFAPNNEKGFQSFTITITRGANDVPMIVSALTTAIGGVTEDSNVVSGNIVTSGTIGFQDVDLTDTHTAAFVLKSSDANANLPGYSESAPLSQIGTFALTAVNENTADTINIGSVGWSFTLDDSNPVLQSLAVGQTITQVYTVTIDDGHGGTVSQDVTVTITGTNDAPTIVVGSTTASGGVIEDSNVVSGNLVTSGTIGFNDVDLIDTHTTSVVAGAGNTLGGTLTMGAVSEDAGTAAGTVGWTYTVADDAINYLAADQTATEKFTVTIADGHGGTVAQVVTITVTGTNDAPTIVADMTTASGGVTEDSNVVSGNLVTSGTIGFNDVDLIDPHTASVVADGGNKLGGTLTMGAVSEDASTAAGTVGWTYKVADHATDYLAAGQTATEKFTVTIDDGNGGKVAQVVTITVTGTNDAPDIHVVTTDSTAATRTETNAGLSICGTLTVNDADFADTVSSLVTTVTASGSITGLGPTDAQLLAMLSVAPASGLAAGPGDSHNLSWTFNAGTQAFNYLAANQSLVLTYTVQSTDSSTSPLSDTQTVTLTINGANDAASIGNPSSASVTENTNVDDDGNLVATGSIPIVDPDHGQSSFQTTVTAADGNLGSLHLNADGTYTYAVANATVEYLAADETKIDIFTVTSLDGTTKDVQFTIYGTDDTPAISVAAGDSASAAKTETNAALTASGTLTVTDADLTDTVTISTAVSGLTHTGPTGGLTDAQLQGFFTLTPTTPLAADPGSTHNLTWNFNSGGQAFDFLAPGESLVLTYTVQGSDGYVGGTTTQSVTVTITGAEDAPAITVGAGDSASATKAETNVGLTASGTLTVTDADLTDTVTASTAVSGLTHTGPTGGLTDAQLQGFFTLAPTTALTADPGSTHNLTWNFNSGSQAFDFLAPGESLVLTYTVQGSDGHVGGTTTQSVTVTITGTDEAPVAVADTVQAVPSGWSFDSANGHYYRYVSASQVTWSAAGTAAIADGGYLATITDASENTFVHNLVGSHNAWLGGSDAVHEGTWAWVVGPENGAVFYINSPQSSPGYSNWNSGEPNNQDHGNHSPHQENYLQILGTGKWNDEQGPNVSSANQTDGYVEEMGRPGIVLANFVEDTPTSIATAALLANDTDVDGGPLVVSAVNATSAHGGTLTLQSGVITYKPSANFNGADQFSYTVSDGRGGTATGTLSFNVAAVNDAPVAIHVEHVGQSAPAGIAGEPINLGLAGTSANNGAVVTMTIADVPSGWTVNGGTLLNDGTWTVQTADPGSLTITSRADFTGAMLFNVTGTWTQADGSTATITVSDNVEAYSVGSPIFALSGDDYLTGSSGSDLFVFAQPISHDVIYSFDAVSDKIDLVGFSGFSDFNDVAAHLSDDGVGNTVLTLASDETITLHGVSSASLSAGNFQFNQQTVLENSADMIIGNGAALPLSGLIENTGVIALNSTGGETDLQLIQSGATLHGGGQIVLSDSDANIISGTSSSVTLNNEDNTISGAGQLGNGELSLANAGTINATGNHVLDIDTGSNIVLNSGVLEASGSGGMTVASAVANSGILWAHGATLTLQGAVSGNGTATIDGTGTLDFEASSTANVVFGSGAAGTLKLGDSFNFSGTISGFEGSDMIDLANLGSANASISYHENAAGTGGTLAISDGAQTVELSLLGKYSADNFSFVPDHVHGTLVTYVPHDLVV